MAHKVAVDALIESGLVASEPTTVTDFVDGVAKIVRVGAGDTAASP